MQVGKSWDSPLVVVCDCLSLSLSLSIDYIVQEVGEKKVPLGGEILRRRKNVLLLLLQRTFPLAYFFSGRKPFFSPSLSEGKWEIREGI